MSKNAKSKSSKPEASKAVAAAKNDSEVNQEKEAAKAKEVAPNDVKAAKEALKAKEKAAREEAKEAERKAKLAEKEAVTPTKRGRGRQANWTRESLVAQMQPMAEDFRTFVNEKGEPTVTIAWVMNKNGVTQNYWNIAKNFMEDNDPDFAFLKEAAAPFLNRKGRISDAVAAADMALARQEKALVRAQERNAERIRKLEEKHQAKMAELAARKAAAEAKAAEVKLQIQTKGQNVAAAVSITHENDDVTVNVGAYMGNAHSHEANPIEVALAH